MSPLAQMFRARNARRGLCPRLLRRLPRHIFSFNERWGLSPVFQLAANMPAGGIARQGDIYLPVSLAKQRLSVSRAKHLPGRFGAKPLTSAAQAAATSVL